MSDIVIKVENLGKQYRLGQIGTGTLSHDLNRFFHKVRGKEDPYLKIGEVNDRTKKGDMDLVWALKNINFEVNQGDVLGIIGKNGAGKSTLLKLLSQITSPSQGSIKIKGRIAALLEVGTGFHPELTGRENVYLNGSILGMTKAEIKSKFDEIVDFSGVERYIDTPVKRYSSGMMVRLGFAVAAHLEPEILIVDEVLAVGDLEFQKKCLGKMKDVSNKGRTVLFVSHNMNAMQQLCNKGILISQGQLVMEDTINAVVNQYIGMSKQNTAEIKDFSRKGSGSVVFKHFFLTDAFDNKIESIIMGQDLYVNLILEKKNDVKSIDVSFIIRNSLGEAISHVRNMDNDFTLPVNKNELLLKIKLEDLLLVPDTYFISLWTGTNSEYYDVIDNCISFDVLNNPEFNRVVYPHNMKVLFRSFWKLS
ncbi:MAG: ABC transporter ATP-binding protein [Bacteroidia bacterium]|nr:ABC transporter ATP-binding protein [Bacteroidia bacterium]